MGYLWHELRQAFPLIVHARTPTSCSLLWVTLRVALVSTSVALVIGLPLGLALGLGRFRGRRTLQLFANASLALPPVVVGVAVLLLLLPQGAFGSLRSEFTLKAVYVAQTILALPYIVALTPGGDPGPSAGAARAGARARRRAAAAVGAGAAGGEDRRGRGGDRGARRRDLRGRRRDLRRRQLPGPRPDARQRAARAVQLLRRLPLRDRDRLVLLGLIIVLIGTLTVLQQRTSGIRLRFRTG